MLLIAALGHRLGGFNDHASCSRDTKSNRWF
jgi:hypothetical protein